MACALLVLAQLSCGLAEVVGVGSGCTQHGFGEAADRRQLLEGQVKQLTQEKPT